VQILEASTHKTKEGKVCKYFCWADHQVHDEMVRTHILKATEEVVGLVRVEEGSDVESGPGGMYDLFFIVCDTDHMHF
jgi:hypothetical protein